MIAAMKQATANAVALVTAMQSHDAATLDGQMVETVEWLGLNRTDPIASRVALQLNQSAHLTTLCIELLAKSTGDSVEATRERLAALIAQYNAN